MCSERPGKGANTHTAHHNDSRQHGQRGAGSNYPDPAQHPADLTKAHPADLLQGASQDYTFLQLCHLDYMLRGAEAESEVCKLVQYISRKLFPHKTRYSAVERSVKLNTGSSGESGRINVLIWMMRGFW